MSAKICIVLALAMFGCVSAKPGYAHHGGYVDYYVREYLFIKKLNVLKITIKFLSNKQYNKVLKKLKIVNH